MSATAHARRGASKIKRLIECPGSERLSFGIRDTSSAAAEEGTRAHAAAEHYLEHLRWPEDASDDMRRHLTHYVNYIIWRRNAVGDENVRIEVRVSLEPLGFSDAFGTSDALIFDYDNRVLEVVDLKYGAGVYVPEVDNDQLRYYALGALVGLSVEQQARFDTIRTTICQPRNGTTKPRHDEFPVIDLVSEFTGRLQRAWERLDAQLTKPIEAVDLAVGDWCKFCPAKMRCPKIRQEANKRAAMAFSGELMNELSILTAEELAEETGKVEALKAWIKALERHATTLAQRGIKIPGMKVVQTWGHRTFSDPEAVLDMLQMFDYDDKDVQVPPKLRSPSQIEELVSGPAWSAIEGYVVKPSLGYKVVPESSKGKAVDGQLDPSIAFRED